MSTAYSNLRRNPFTAAYSWRVMDTEIHTIAQFSELPGIYGIHLQDKPKEESVEIVENITGGDEFTEVTTDPLQGQFRVDYTGGYVFFNILDNGTEVAVDYEGGGTNATKEALEGMVNNEPRIAALESAVLETGGLEDRMDVAESDISTNETDIETLDTQINETGGIDDRLEVVEELVGTVHSVDGNITIADDDGYETILMSNSGGDADANLPVLANNYNRVLLIILSNQTGTNKASINANGADTISGDGLSSIDLVKQGNYLKIIGDEDAGCWTILDESLTCEIQIDTYAGYGAVDTKIPQFTNLRESIGNLMTENHSTGYDGGDAGLEITIVKSGDCSFAGTFCNGAAVNSAGLTLNSTQLTTAIISVNAEDIKGCQVGSANRSNQFSFKKYLDAGDVVRIHTEGQVPGIAGLCNLIVSYGK